MGDMHNGFAECFTNYPTSNFSLAGRLVECGAQVTGGVSTDRHRVPDWVTDMHNGFSRVFHKLSYF